MNKTPLAAAISSVFAVGGMTAPQVVFGQDDDDEAEGIEEVVVTGSRIKKDAFTTSTPMDIIDVDSASIQGIANIGELLQTNTAAAGSQQVTPFTGTEFVENGGIGASTVSLRGLGANRTLVLLNGRRAGPSGIGGGVSSFDLNVMPINTIERVEILKDGASSIYGSDAVAGVVNIITRKDDGGSIDGFMSMPADDGGEESSLSLSYGKTFDRGNFRVTADYNKKSQLRRGSRDYFTCGNQYIFDQTTGERADVVDPRTGEFWCEDLTWGHIWVYDYAPDTNIPSAAGSNVTLFQFDYDNNLGQFIPNVGVVNDAGDIVQPAGWFPVSYDRASDGVTNDDHPFQDRQSLIPETELITLYAEGEYEITEDITAYTEVLFNRRTTTETDYRQYWSYVYSGDYDFSSLGTGVPGGGNSLSAAAGWFGDQWYSPTAITDHNDQENEVDYTRVLAGLRGSFGDNWDWDLTVQHSDSQGSSLEDVIFNDSIRDQNWLSGSCVGTTTSSRGVPCIDIPWLDPELQRGNISQELRDFLFATEERTTDYTQTSVDGFVTGSLYELPAGTLSGAFGFHYREDEITDTPGAVTLAGNAWRQTAGITTGDDSTIAYFAEFDAPLIVDKPGFENLTLNASARYTDVDSYGSDTTWKVGINWQIVDSFRLRANRGTSFRSPALFELFLADREGSISQRSDPCIRYQANFDAGNISQNVRDNCAADPRNLPPDYTGGTITPTVFTGGGFGVLEAETSKSLTVGFVWQPAFANLSIAIDYFDYDVRDEVDQLGGERIIASCYESDFGFAFGGTEPLCNLFDRSSINNGIDNVRDSFINIAQQRNRGYDFVGRYVTDIGPGSATLEVKATRQVEDVRALFEDTAEDLNGLVGDPEWVGETKLTYDFSNWSLYWGMNWIGETSQVEEFGRNTVTYRGVDYLAELETENVFYHTLSGSYDFGNGITVRAGVANVLDENPPQLTRVQTGAEFTMIGNSVLMSNYDMIGRRFFANASWTFE